MKDRSATMPWVIAMLASHPEGWTHKRHYGMCSQSCPCCRAANPEDMASGCSVCRQGFIFAQVSRRAQQALCEVPRCAKCPVCSETPGPLDTPGPPWPLAQADSSKPVASGAPSAAMFRSPLEQETERLHLELRNGWWYCTICALFATEEHLYTKKHKRYVNMVATGRCEPYAQRTGGPCPPVGAWPRHNAYQPPWSEQSFAHTARRHQAVHVDARIEHRVVPACVPRTSPASPASSALALSSTDPQWWRLPRQFQPQHRRC